MTDLAKILEKSHYQTFDLIEGDKRDSDTLTKYKLSRLDSFDLTNKSILDIGSNAGYFLFKLAEKCPSKLTGIELGQKFVQISNDLNEQHYKVPNLDFILADFFTHQFNEKFDLILCLSTFHYFGDNQEIFFTNCHNLLTKGGTLLLEIEEYPTNTTPTTDIDPRDPNRRYPNNLQLQEYLRKKFTIIKCYPSVNQPGSVHNRWFYELRKLDSVNIPSTDKRPLLGEYMKTIITLTGPSNIGKSTITELLLNDKFQYISIDLACLTSKMPEIQLFLKKFKESGENINYHVGALINHISENYPNFIDHFFNEYILYNENLNLFVEGCVFIYDNLHQRFIDKCKEHNYRIWDLRRTL